MPSTAIIASILILVISFIFGIVTFYFVSDIQKDLRKKRSEEVSSQIINVILFIWLAKVLLNLPVFIGDPLAILAYPGDKNAFYLAVFFSGALIFHRTREGKIDGLAVAQALTYVIVPAAFMYEFLQFTWNGEVNAFRGIILYAVLLAVLLSLQGRFSTYRLLSIAITGWAAGMLLIMTFQPYVTMFGYLMEPWFILLFFVIGQFIILFYSRRRKA
ncbi:hypothetical protein [Jeotgalibacillus proteolyticus]|uniref:hypothetical protein n=1 Tax=Jeotgalibacillus proteolyticus TaxID=2082395 RepID=UPI003CF6A6D9